MYDWDLYAGFIPVCGSIIGGYLVAVLTHMLLTYMVTRQGRRVLVGDGGMSSAYYVQVGLCWMIAGAAGAKLALHVFPDALMGLASVISIAGMICLAIVRLKNKTPHQQSWVATVALLFCVVLGMGITTALHLI